MLALGELLSDGRGRGALDGRDGGGLLLRLPLLLRLLLRRELGGLKSFSLVFPSIIYVIKLMRQLSKRLYNWYVADRGTKKYFRMCKWEHTKNTRSDR